MPLPLIIGGIATVAGVAGAGSGIHGGLKLKKANKTTKEAKNIQDKVIAMVEETNEKTMNKLEELGNKELRVLESFKEFSDVFEKIKNRPEFKKIYKQKIKMPKYSPEEIKKVSVRAGVFLGGIGGTTAGVTGGLAAAGATSSAVMAMGTASTGTAISSLTGVAAHNAALAALGGGSLAVNGGGMALGTMVLSGATLGIGLLIGGAIFNATGSKISNRAEEALEAAKLSEKEGLKIVNFLERLKDTSIEYIECINNVTEKYYSHLSILKYIVENQKKNNWEEFTEEERKITEETVLLVNLLYRMCKVNLVNKSDDKNEMNTLNKSEITEVMTQADMIINDL